MDPVSAMLVPGVLGGLAMAWLIARLHRRRQGGDYDPFRNMPPIDVINMSHLRVAGVGGLGLVAMSVAVALDVPRIGRSIGIALVLGACMAAILIAWRRRSGPMPSSGRHSGANAMLSIDEQNGPGATAQSPRSERQDPRFSIRLPAATR